MHCCLLNEHLVEEHSHSLVEKRQKNCTSILWCCGITLGEKIGAKTRGNQEGNTTEKCDIEKRTRRFFPIKFTGLILQENALYINLV